MKQYSDHELDSQMILHALMYLLSQYVSLANCGLVDPSHIDLISGITTTFNVVDADADIDDGGDDKDNDCVDDDGVDDDDVDDASWLIHLYKGITGIHLERFIVLL